MTGRPMAVHKQLRCPSCGALSTIEHASCPACGTSLAPQRDSVDMDDVLADVSDLMEELNAKTAPGSPEIGEKRSAATVAPPAPSLAAPAPKKEMAGSKEVYQCLICGSTIPPDARHCRVCGTIFVDESLAHDFRGIPVTKIGRSSEIDPGDHELGQTRRPETVKMAPVAIAKAGAPQRPIAARAPEGQAPDSDQPRRVDELPGMEVEGAKRPVVKKKIIKRKV